MQAPRRKARLSVAVPASLVAEFKNLREKTEIIGRLARSAAIFRVDEILIYPDEPNEAQLLRLLLSYIETPQYLRRHLFKIRPELQYVGVLPPLRTPHHPLANQVNQLSVGEYREGAIVEVRGGNFYADIGVEKPLRINGKSPSPGSRLTAKVTQTQPTLEGVAVGKGEIQAYWGYQVTITKKGLGDLAKLHDLTVATSRTGVSVVSEEERLRGRLAEARSVLVAFGSPRDGLQEILWREKVRVEEAFQFNLNTIPSQGCETVRSEEAVHATLAILNLLQA